jgi:hypothetical protein
LHPLGSFLCQIDAAGNVPTSVHLIRDPVTLNLFTVISCEIDHHTSRTNQHIFLSVDVLRRPVGGIVYVAASIRYVNVEYMP